MSGIVFVSGLHSDVTNDPARYQQLTGRRLPVVFVNGYLEDVDAPFISADDAVATELAVRHLISLGHRTIGFACGPDRYTPVRRKLEAFEKQLADAPGVRGLVEQSMFSLEGGQAAALRLLAQGATGVVCGSDLMALGVVRAARQGGLQVPKRVSVVGYDDSPLIAFTDPPLTTVRQPVRTMGLAAVRALIDEIQGRGAPHAEYFFRPELVVRSSTDSARPTPNPLNPNPLPMADPADSG